MGGAGGGLLVLLSKFDSENLLFCLLFCLFCLFWMGGAGGKLLLLLQSKFDSENLLSVTHSPVPLQVAFVET